MYAGFYYGGESDRFPPSKCSGENFYASPPELLYVGDFPTSLSLYCALAFTSSLSLKNLEPSHINRISSFPY